MTLKVKVTPMSNESGDMLLLDTDSKSYNGSPTVSLDLILSGFETQIQGRCGKFCNGGT